MDVAALLREPVARFLAIDGYDRGLALAAQAFVAVVPLLVVLGTWGPGGGWLLGRLDLDEQTAGAVRALLARPPEPDDPVTVLGLGLLVTSLLGFARTLQRTFEAAWALPRSGLRGYGPGLLGAAAFFGEVVGLSALGRLLGALPLGGLLVGLLWVVAGALAWWPVQRLLVGGRVPWRDLAPGAVVTGLAQAAVMALSSLYLGPMLTAQARRYGEFGVAATFVTALTVLGVLLVAGAALGPTVAALRAATRHPVGEPR